MTLYTSPDGLPVVESSDFVAPLEDYFGDLSVAMQAALLRPSAVSSASARDAAIPSPIAGQSVWRIDEAWREMYLPVGPVRTAGWFPIEGAVPGVFANTAAAMNNVAVTTTTPLKFSAVTLLRGITYDLGTGKATVTQAGLYSIQGSARPTTLNTDNRVQVVLNGAAYALGQASTAGVGVPLVAATLPLSVGDVVSVDWYSATAQTLNSGQRFLGINYLGPA